MRRVSGQVPPRTRRRPRATDSTETGEHVAQDAQGAGIHGKARLLAGAEVAAKRFPVRLSAQSSGDLIPGPVGGTGFPHGDLDCLLSDAPRVNGGVDQLFNSCRHAIDSVTECDTDRATLDRSSDLLQRATQAAPFGLAVMRTRYVRRWTGPTQHSSTRESMPVALANCSSPPEWASNR